MKWIVSIFTVLLLVITSVVSFAQDQMFSIEGRYWMPAFSAKMQVSDSIANPTKVDDDVLNIKKENFYDLRASFKLTDAHTIRATYIPISYKGDTVLTSNIVFGDQIFAAGSAVSTKLDIDYARLGWLWKIFDNKKNMRFSTILEVKGLFARATLDAPQQPARHKYTIDAYIPTIGGIFEASLHKTFGFYVEATGITVGSRGYLFDGEAGLKWMPCKNFAIDGGYRAYSVKFDKSDDYFKLNIHGPYMGVRIMF